MKDSILTTCSGPWVLRTQDEHILQMVEWTFVLDGKLMSSLEEVYDEISKKISLPPYFGRNYNALSEMLSDLSWDERSSYKILIQDASYILSKESDETLSGFLDVLSQVGEEWSRPIQQGQPWDRPCIPFHTVLHLNSTASRLPFYAVRPLS